MNRAAINNPWIVFMRGVLLPEYIKPLLRDDEEQRPCGPRATPESLLARVCGLQSSGIRRWGRSTVPQPWALARIADGLGMKAEHVDEMWDALRDAQRHAVEAGGYLRATPKRYRKA